MTVASTQNFYRREKLGRALQEHITEKRGILLGGFTDLQKTVVTRHTKEYTSSQRTISYGLLKSGQGKVMEYTLYWKIFH